MEARGKHLETLLVLVTGMTVFFLFTDRREFLYVGAGIGILGLAIPVAGKYIHLGWTTLSKVLGFVNSHIVLTIVFFVALTPLAILRRLSKSDKLRLRRKQEGSYYHEREHSFEPKDLGNPW